MGPGNGSAPQIGAPCVSIRGAGPDLWPLAHVTDCGPYSPIDASRVREDVGGGNLMSLSAHPSEAAASPPWKLAGLIAGLIAFVTILAAPEFGPGPLVRPVAANQRLWSRSRHPTRSRSSQPLWNRSWACVACLRLHGRDKQMSADKCSVEVASTKLSWTGRSSTWKRTISQALFAVQDHDRQGEPRTVELTRTRSMFARPTWF